MFIKLLIGSRNGLIYYNNGHQEFIDKGFYYGITWDLEHVYAARFDDINIYDYNFNKVGTIKYDCLRTIHQLLYCNNKLYICNTYQDTILSYDGTNLVEYSWRPLKEDIVHINSIYFDNNYFWVCEHRNRKDIPIIVKLDKNFHILKEIKILKALKSGIHNIYVNDKIYTLLFGMMLEINKNNGNSRRYELDNEFDEYTYNFVYCKYMYRGFAKYKKGFLVGASNACERVHRAEGNGHIHVLNDSFNCIDKLVIKDAGQIHEVRTLDFSDDSHNGIVLRK